MTSKHPSDFGIRLQNNPMKETYFPRLCAIEETWVESVVILSCRLICVVQDVVLCFPGRWNWNRKLRRSQTWGFHDMFPHMFRLEDPCSMTCDIGLWKMRLLNAFKFAFALWVLPMHDNRLLIFVSSRMNQVQERTSRKNYTYLIISILYYYDIMTDPLV